MEDVSPGGESIKRILPPGQYNVFTTSRLMDPVTIRIAIIGVGIIGPRHMQSVLACDGASLAAMVGPGDSARVTSELHGVPSYHTVEELLQSPTALDAAIVCTPNSTHVSISKLLLAAGVHVLVEKPIALDIESGEDLVTATKQAVDDGGIGRPIAVSGLWMLYKPAAYYEGLGAWRAASEGGVILINMVHEIDTLRYMLGPIVRVHAEQTAVQRQHEAEEGAAVILKFASGVVGTFMVCDAAPSPHSFEAGTGENPIVPRSGKDFCRIFGSDGVVSMGDMTITRHRSTDEKSWSNDLETMSIEAKDCVPFDEQIAHFVRVIKGEEKPRCTAEDGLGAVKAVEAIKQAMRTGKAVDIGTSQPKL
ncbi:hypothetical protein B0A48_04152 [Cryoendolithus antarcticus]|uniref:Gfo/Idh/MocA-like oxidoreductase C-terminal domain-containing protein n=1 Tax=Cryoendolithus antarcticus TaxID=1507870 RepID=A0A1V8THY5_9PEZI|nr:hypothetical protein B0A48_04152 [Cryoendolithus antarcticus]